LLLLMCKYLVIALKLAGQVYTAVALASAAVAAIVYPCV